MFRFYICEAKLTALERTFTNTNREIQRNNILARPR